MRAISRKNSERGAVMMEFVVVFPILMMVLFLVFQFAQLFLVKQLLHYASFVAARTAVVYHPLDYGKLQGDGQVVFAPMSGPVYESAVIVLSWLEKVKAYPYNLSEWVPDGTAKAWSRVRIEGQERLGDDSLGIFVTVHYYFPIAIPMARELLAYFLAGGSGIDLMQMPDYSRKLNSIAGLPQTDIPPKRIYRDENGQYLMHLRSTCMMPKPHSTMTYTRIPRKNAAFVDVSRPPQRLSSQ